MTDLGTFKCDACKGVFPKARSDEEAEADALKLHGNIPIEDRATVCHNCWLKMKHLWENVN